MGTYIELPSLLLVEIQSSLAAKLDADHDVNLLHKWQKAWKCEKFLSASAVIESLYMWRSLYPLLSTTLASRYKNSTCATLDAIIIGPMHRQLMTQNQFNINLISQILQRSAHAHNAVAIYVLHSLMW